MMNIRNKVAGLAKFIQVPLLHLSYILSKAVSGKPPAPHWVIGVDEVAGVIQTLGNVLDPSITVSLTKNKFYEFEYDYHLTAGNVFINHLFRLFYGPILLGYLANKGSHFLYIWSTGFLFDRDLEYRFLKSKRKTVVSFFVGDDIRAPRLLQTKLREMEVDGFTEYFAAQYPKYLSEEYDLRKRKLAASSDKYADLVFSFPLDQISYLTCHQHPFIYMYDPDLFVRSPAKFESVDRIRVVHAPSNPMVKGTPLVRAAIKKLKTEGYDFDYIELQNVTNDEVLSELASAHIVLNQFYTFVPGIFGIEAMAHHCAVLMSADPEIETALLPESRDAWVVTKYWEIYDKLRALLDHPENIREYADRGYDFAFKHCTYEAAREKMHAVFREQGIL